MALKHNDRKPEDTFSVPPPEIENERSLEKDLRPEHHEQTHETRGARFGYWQVGGATRSAIKRLKRP